MRNQKKNAYLQTLSSTLNQMRENRVLTDLEVSCDNEVFHVHSAVMSASSTYFRNLLNNSSKPLKISLNGIQPIIFAYLLKFIYTGTVEDSLDLEKLGLLIEACSWLNIPELFQQIGSIAAEIISYANYFTVWNLADQFHIESLTQEVEDFVASNYMKLTSKETFLELSAARLRNIFTNKNFREISSENILISLSNWAQHKADRQKQLPQLIQQYQESLCNRKCGDTEKKTKCIDQCKYVDKEKRNKFNEMTEFIKPITITDSFESSHTYPVGLSVSFEAPEKDTNDMRSNGYRFQQSIIDDNIFTPSNNRKMNMKTTEINKNVSQDSNQTYCVYRFHDENEHDSDDEGTIHSEPAMSQSESPKKSESIHSCQDNYLGFRRFNFDIASHVRRSKGTIRNPHVNIGPPKRPRCLQEESEERVRSVRDLVDTIIGDNETLPSIQNERRILTQLPCYPTPEDTTPRYPNSYDGASPDSFRIMIFFRKRLGDVNIHSFQLDTNVWDTPFDLQSILFKKKVELFNQAANVVLNNRIFYIGGCDSKDIPQVQNLMLDFENAEIVKVLMPLPTARSRAGAASLGAKIFIIGGKGSNNQVLDNVECFSLMKNEWQSLSPFPIKAWGLTVIASSEYLYTIGGRRKCEWGLGCYSYDPKADQWSHINNLPKELNSSPLEAVLVGNEIFAFRHHNARAAGSVSILNIGKNTWTSPDVSAMSRFPKKVLSAFAWQSRIWVVSAESRLHVYNIARQAWEMEFPFQKIVRMPLYAFLVHCSGYIL